MNDLQTIHKEDFIFPIEVNEEALTELERQCNSANIPTDLNVKTNYNAVKEMVHATQKSLTITENTRKEKKRPFWDAGQKIDAIAKEIKGRITTARDPWVTAKKDHDAAIEIAKKERKRKEEERIEKICTRIASIKSWPAIAIDMKSDNILGMLQNMEYEEYHRPVWAEEYQEKAAKVIDETRNQLQNLHDMKVMAEKAARAAAEREKEEEERQRQRAIEQEKLAAENIKKAADLQAASDRLAFERKAFEDKEAVVREEQRTKAKQKAFAEDKKKAEANLEVSFEKTLEAISPWICDERIAVDFINKVRTNEFTHIKWVD
ncbi:MAG: hypothetical protein U9N19_03925 [Thermodesulfobacteriota bacterium]|nr:hypothetical protein [Thermodesulfobacteriota bacterium]